MTEPTAGSAAFTDGGGMEYGSVTNTEGYATSDPS